MKMPGRTILATVITLLLLPISGCETNETTSSSTLIVNALILDGNGGETFAGAVRFDGDRIIDVGELAHLQGETVIDAGGLALAPGFIDTHSHHDREIDKYRHMPGVLSQGVTTIVRGVDGSTSGSMSIAEYNATITESPAAVNIASFSPHNTIREHVMGDDYRRVATREEIDAMAALVNADMQAGALGLSTGLEYEPGIFSSTEEIIELAKAAARHGGRYSSHVRDEDDNFVDAINEIIRIGREADIPVHITHIKLADKFAWGSTDDIIALLDTARADGVDLTADIYPYERWASNLAVLFPERDFTSRATAEFTFTRTAAADDILLIDYPPNRGFEGMTIAQVAAVTERDEITTLLELSQAAEDHRRKTGEDTGIIAKSMNNDDISAFMKWPYMNICSDGWHDGHPRGSGSFPRVLGRFVREQGVLSLPEAIYKMTGRSADSMGIKERGRIAPGKYADLVLFDPDTVIDHATMTSPAALSEGIVKVWVNGVLAYDQKVLGTTSGRSIRRDE
jgi:N-acyl-D-amino-acid deacylase